MQLTHADRCYFVPARTGTIDSQQASWLHFLRGQSQDLAALGPVGWPRFIYMRPVKAGQNTDKITLSLAQILAGHG